jgi:hypothetical protein
MEERLKNLEGITYSEWQKLRLVIDNRFEEIKYQSTLDVTKSTLDELKALIG